MGSIFDLQGWWHPLISNNSSFPAHAGGWEWVIFIEHLLSLCHSVPLRMLPSIFIHVSAGRIFFKMLDVLKGAIFFIDLLLFFYFYFFKPVVYLHLHIIVCNAGGDILIGWFISFVAHVADFLTCYRAIGCVFSPSICIVIVSLSSATVYALNVIIQCSQMQQHTSILPDSAKAKDIRIKCTSPCVRPPLHMTAAFTPSPSSFSL